MKAKKVNKIEAVRNLLSANPKIKTAEVMEKLRTSKTYTYVLMSKARKLNKEESAPKGKLLYRLTGTQAILAQKMGVPVEDYAKLHGEVVGVAPDPVNRPAHYTAGGIETIDFIEAKKLNYNIGNVVKYLTRADHKGNKLEDLRKAQWYLTREINSMK
jgi:succinate dehydrogenase/fumarate reductase flavoprotein subunit